MSFAVQTEIPPLHEDADGALRVGQSRVLLDLVIHAFQDGATPETIIQRYPTLALQDVYTVIGYYLRHTDEVESYLTERDRLAGELRATYAYLQKDLSHIRARLSARRQSKS